MKYLKSINELKKMKSDLIYDFSELYVNKIADKLGVKLVKKLGKGSFGHAYLTNKNTVLKLTVDQSEANNAKKLIGENTKHFVNYYDVKKIKLKKEGLNHTPVYSIIMEKVGQLNDKEKRVWKDIRWIFFDPGNNIVADDYKKDSEIVKKFLKDRRDMIIEGEKYEINFKDASHNNIGFRKNGSLVYFDIGYYDNIYIDGKEDIEIEEDIYENDYSKIKDILKSKYKPNSQIEIKELVGDVSKGLNISRRKSYQYIKDEIFYNYRKITGDNSYLNKSADTEGIRILNKEKLIIYFTNGFNNSVDLPLEKDSSYNSKDIWITYTDKY